MIVGNPYPHTAQIRNLVFEGGGVKGIAYLGAVQKLYEILGTANGKAPEQIEAVAGASAGSITALVLSFGLDFQSTKEIVDTFPYHRVAEPPGPHNVPNPPGEGWKLALKALGEVIGEHDAWGLYNMYENYGWYDTRHILHWFRHVIHQQFQDQEQFQSKPDCRITFADFASRSDFKALSVVATNVTRRRRVVFSAETTPDVEVAEAVRMSMSIPVYFSSVERNGDHFCDGGVVDNYAIDLFPDEGKRRWETLGFHLCGPTDDGAASAATSAVCCGSDEPYPGVPQRNCPSQPRATNLVSYLESLFDALLIPSSKIRREDVNRTVNINNYCVNTTDFHIKKDSTDYHALVNNGYGATEAFFCNWPPTGGCPG